MKKLKIRAFCCAVFAFIMIFRYFLFSDDIKDNAGKNILIQNDIEQKTKKEKIEFYELTGDAYLEKNRYGDAINYYSEALKLERRNAGILQKLGDAYRITEINEEAIKAYNESIACGKETDAVYTGLGLIYDGMLLYEKAENYFLQSLELNRENAVAEKCLAEIYYKKGEYPKALEYYKKILSSESNQEIKDKIALLYVLTSNYAEAKKYFSQSLKSSVLRNYIELYGGSDPVAGGSEDSDNGIFINGLVLLREGNPSAARINFEALANAKEDSLAKKLSMVLCGKPR